MRVQLRKGHPEERSLGIEGEGFVHDVGEPVLDITG